MLDTIRGDKINANVLYNNIEEITRNAINSDPGNIHQLSLYIKYQLLTFMYSDVCRRYQITPM